MTQITHTVNPQWRQGGLLPQDAHDSLRCVFPECFNNATAGAVRIVVISHSCDILRDPTVEPSVEVLVASSIVKGDRRYTRGRHPRKYHLKLEDVTTNTACWYEASIDDRYRINKQWCIDFGPCDRYVLADGEKQNLIKWVAYRYTRTAFPNQFDERRNQGKVREQIDKLLKKVESDYLAEIYVRVSDQELPTDQNYVIDLRGTITCADDESSDQLEYTRWNTKTKRSEVAMWTKRQIVDNMVDEIRCLLDSCDGITVRSSQCVNETELTLHDLKSYQRWTQYDYLSASDEVSV